MREVISCQCHYEGQMRLCWVTGGGGGRGGVAWGGDTVVGGCRQNPTQQTQQFVRKSSVRTPYLILVSVKV